MKIMRSIIFIETLLFIIFLTSCKEEEVPTIETTAINDITATTATSGGNITNEGSGPIIERGICYGTENYPEITDNRTSDGVGAGTFISLMSNLNPGTTYYARAYATNSAGTGYGMEEQFITVGGLPSASAGNPINIGYDIATIGGFVNANNLSTIAIIEYGTSTRYGFTIIPSQSPVTGNSDIFVNAKLSELKDATTYHYRIQATNLAGTIYSNDALFTTLPRPIFGEVITDVDGNSYKTVPIGTQTWMAENLKTTKYRNGEAIPNITDNAAWSVLTTGAFSYYNNDYTNFGITYGALYNWYTVKDKRQLCPTGWHVPSQREWNTLITYVGHTQGGKLKEVGNLHWTSLNDFATNITGFTALPGGSRGKDGGYGLLGTNCLIWSTDSFWHGDPVYEGIYFGIRLDILSVDGNARHFNTGLSVRCIKD